MANDLSAEALTVKRGPRVVLREVRLEAQGGTVVAILGPNGAGKSTLLSALAGLLPFEGRVCVDGRELASMSREQRAKRVAYVPQRSALAAALSVRSVVEQGRYPHRGAFAPLRPSDRSAIETAMERADVQDLAARRFDQLSLGERRRVLLARALATEAGVLLLDEPTAALDVGHELDLHALLTELAADGLSIVVVLHGLDAARRHADRAILLDGGAMIATGPVADVVTASRVREVYGVSLLEDAALAFRRERP